MNKFTPNKKVLISIVCIMMAILVPISFFLFGVEDTSSGRKNNDGDDTMQTNPSSSSSVTTKFTTIKRPTSSSSRIPTTYSRPTTSSSTTKKPTAPSSTTKKPTTSSSTTQKPTTSSSTTSSSTTQPKPGPDFSGAFKVVENGVSKSVIVVAENYTEKSLEAAADLQDYISKMTGVTVEMYMDSWDMPEDKFLILVGPTKYTSQVGVTQPKGYPSNEKFIVKRSGRYLALIGNDDGAFIGTQFAVTRFLEEMGCGWYGTRALWNVVPEVSSVTCGDLNITETPKFISRSNRLHEKYPELTERWYMGGVHTLVGQHFLMATVGNGYRYSNPDWYARTGDNGSYINPADGYWQFCYSSTGLANKVAQVVMDYWTNTDPDCYVYSITPNDGFSFGICQCSGCKRFSNDTDLIINFANNVAKLTKGRFPDRQVSILTYHTTLPAPTGSRPVESNVEIMFCTETSMTKPTSQVDYIGMAGKIQYVSWKSNFQTYISRTGVQHRSVWKWLCIAAEGTSANWQYIPWVQGNVATDDHQFWKDNGVSYVFYDQGPLNGYREYESSVSLRWPLWYVAGKGCWAQGKSGQQLLREACQKLYGNGAEAMLGYYMALANASAACTAKSHAWAAPAPSAVYTSSQINTINNKVAAVEATYDQVTAVQKQRMQEQMSLWAKAKQYI